MYSHSLTLIQQWHLVYLLPTYVLSHCYLQEDLPCCPNRNNVTFCQMGSTSISILRSRSSQWNPHCCPQQVCAKDSNWRRPWHNKAPAESSRKPLGWGLGDLEFFWSFCIAFLTSHQYTLQGKLSRLSLEMLTSSSACCGCLARKIWMGRVWRQLRAGCAGTEHVK